MTTNSNYLTRAPHPALASILKALKAPERRWFQRWIGCALTGHQPKGEGALLILVGGGSNGKSVLMTAIARAFGSYACYGSDALLSPSNSNDFMHAAAELKDVRLCYVGGFPKNVLHGKAIERMVCTTTMTGRHKCQKPFTFKPTHSLMVSTNVMPLLKDCTEDDLRRVAVLPFNYHYVDDPKPGTNERLRDPSLLRELDTPEAQEAILAWAIEGAKAYFNAGQQLLPPTQLMQATKEAWLSK